jgi:hypothetical protein
MVEATLKFGIPHLVHLAPQPDFWNFLANNKNVTIENAGKLTVTFVLIVISNQIGTVTNAVCIRCNTRSVQGVFTSGTNDTIV